MSNLEKIEIPSEFNYIGVFLTLRCNLNCSYCLNRFGKLDKAEEMNGTQWIEGLNRLVYNNGLPISFQGGEPTIHPDFYTITRGLWEWHNRMDLLTNGTFDLREFYQKIKPEVFRRCAKYASIRISLHDKTDLVALGIKVSNMQSRGYEVGVWGIETDNNKARISDAKSMFRWLNIDFRVKEFLGRGWKGDSIHGTYKYPDAVSGKRQTVWCKGSELLINPAGYVFRCHRDLYSGENNLGHILDPGFKIKPGFFKCDKYGECNPCDLKLKTDRYQKGGHCSVEVKMGKLKENG